MHAHTHTHTEKYVITSAFPRLHFFRESASIVRCVYIACLVGFYILYLSLPSFNWFSVLLTTESIIIIEKLIFALALKNLCGLCLGLKTLPRSCADCLEILGASTFWSPKGSVSNFCRLYVPRLFICSPTHAKCLAYRIHFLLITLTISCKE